MQTPSSPGSRDSDYRLAFLCIFLIWAAGFWVMLQAPDAVVESRSAQGLIHFMAPIADMHHLLGVHGSRPGILRLYFSVVWCSFPIWLGMLWHWLSSQVGVSQEASAFFRPRLSRGNRVRLLLGLPLWLGAAYGLTFNGMNDTLPAPFKGAMLTMAPWQVAYLGMLLPSVSAWMLNLSWLSLRRLLDASPQNEAETETETETGK